MKATSTYCVEGRLKIEQNDTIAIVDGRPELQFIKGQNQRTFEIGTFPRNILEVLRFNRHGTLNTISRPVQGTFQHTAHGSSAGGGVSWGVPSYLDSSYNGANVQLRQKTGDQVSKSIRQQKAVSEHFVKEKKAVANKQFAYNKLVNDNRMAINEIQLQQNSMKNRSKPARPPLPSMQPTEGILIDLSPEEIRSINMNMNVKNQAISGAQMGCILDEPIDIPTEHELEQQQLQQSQRMPPPYPMPPSLSQYSNLNVTNDPFDTTHIVAPVENLYANSTMQQNQQQQQLGSVVEPIYNNHPNQFASTSSTASLNELLSASLASLSISTNNNSNGNINGQPVTPKRIEKQSLAEQLQSANATKENTPVKVNLEQRMNNIATTTAASASTLRNYDFTPYTHAEHQANNGNYSNSSYITQPTTSSMHYDSNIYNSVAGDSIYGENFYDAVQSQTPSVIYESTASVYGIQQQQQALYDEVAAYEEVAWRPQNAALRPAPAPPTSQGAASPLLSQQQINRRMEKMNQQYGRVAELMNTLSMDNMTEEEAKQALEASNWNQDLATRYFKIERLSK